MWINFRKELLWNWISFIPCIKCISYSLRKNIAQMKNYKIHRKIEIRSQVKKSHSFQDKSVRNFIWKVSHVSSSLMKIFWKHTMWKLIFSEKNTLLNLFCFLFRQDSANVIFFNRFSIPLSSQMTNTSNLNDQ